jgi:hypothetical protein
VWDGDALGREEAHYEDVHHECATVGIYEGLEKLYHH